MLALYISANHITFDTSFLKWSTLPYMCQSSVPQGGGVTPTVGESGAKQQNTLDNWIFFNAGQKWIVFNETLRHEWIFCKMTLGVFNLFDSGIFSQNKANANQVVFVAKPIPQHCHNLR